MPEKQRSDKHQSDKEKIVLAYSGGLDTSIIVPWLKENYDYDVIATVADVGQGDDVEAVVSKAYKTGASKVVVEDLREEFLTGCMQLLSVDGYLCRALRRLRPHESGKARQALHQQKGALVGHHLRHEIGPVLADESLEQFAVDVLEQGVEVLIGLHENDLAGRGRRSRALLVAGVHQVHPRVGLLRFHLRGELAERLQHGLGFVVVVGLYVPLRN